MILATDLKSHFDYINRVSLLFPKKAGSDGDAVGETGSKVAAPEDKTNDTGNRENDEQKLRECGRAPCARSSVATGVRACRGRVL